MGGGRGVGWGLQRLLRGWDPRTQLSVGERRDACQLTTTPPTAAQASERTAFDDERELKREQAAARAKEQADRLRAAYEELQTTDKARDMREQELLRARMGLAYRMGDTAEAHRLAARLAPDDPANPGR